MLVFQLTYFFNFDLGNSLTIFKLTDGKTIWKDLVG